jgi:hypothetical protein
MGEQLPNSTSSLGFIDKLSNSLLTVSNESKYLFS